jgi:Zn-finger nucleic acid-binding protein
MHTCPRCRRPLTAGDYEGFTVETCDGCGGRWLAAAELRDILDTLPGPAVPPAPARRVQVDAVDEHLPCPNCGLPMEAFNYGADSGVILDKCRPCGGLWLDGGELDAVRQAVAASEAGLDRDVKRFSADLHAEEVRQDELEQKDVRPRHDPLLAALTGRIVDARGAREDGA